MICFGNIDSYHIHSQCYFIYVVFIYICIYFEQMEEYAKAEEISRKARVSCVSHGIATYCICI